VLKSFQEISRVSVELKTDVSEISSVSIIRVDMLLLALVSIILFNFSVLKHKHIGPFRTVLSVLHIVTIVTEFIDFRTI
jgi:hypothetical protein